MAHRILVIRGGAIGDFILTLPAVGLLRKAFPAAHIALLGYSHVASLAAGRYYADEACSIESGRLAGFFGPGAELDANFAEYFASFGHIISYLFDPGGTFAANLRQAGAQNVLIGPSKPTNHSHAALQLAAPLESLALRLESTAATFYPSASDKLAAERLLCRQDGLGPLVAVHPGSGSERKNWPLDRWIEFIRWLLASYASATVLFACGESDIERVAAIRGVIESTTERVLYLNQIPLPTLGALLARCDAFVGHDSGISHLAAAAGCPCLLLFGPTDPGTWAPTNEGVTVLRSRDGMMKSIAVHWVCSVFAKILPS